MDSESPFWERGGRWRRWGEEVQSRGATGVGIPTIGRYTNHLSWSALFIKAKGGALLNVQKSVNLGIFATFCQKMGHNLILWWQPWCRGVKGWQVRRCGGVGIGVPGARCQVSGAGCQVAGAGWQVLGAWLQVPGAGCRLAGARCPVPGARCQVPGAPCHRGGQNLRGGVHKVF